MSQRPTTEVPAFVKSRTPEGLRRKMLQNNAKSRISHHYFDVQYADGSWYAWYYFNEPKFSVLAPSEAKTVKE